MSSNYRRNKAFIDKYRKELRAMLDDISEIDKRVLNEAVKVGLKDAKNNTPVVTGFMRRSWRAAPAVKSKSGEVTKTLVNTADYASYVNYGSRIVNKKGETVGFKKGRFILEKAVGKAEKEIVRLFEEEVERVNQKHDK